ncbi:hypothetical protein Acsp04_59630 [Actinomadura sp. NBRC 104425]|nr:hypothetical protein Acsp04_59630 [Actinomadura sp. NBRC 104425]
MRAHAHSPKARVDPGGQHGPGGQVHRDDRPGRLARRRQRDRARAGAQVQHPDAARQGGLPQGLGEQGRIRLWAVHPRQPQHPHLSPNTPYTSGKRD